MSNYTFKIYTHKFNYDYIGSLDMFLNSLVKASVIICENELIGIGRPYSEYVFHMYDREKECEVLSVLHSVSNSKAVKSVTLYKDGFPMNVISMYRLKPLEPQDILLNIMPPREVALVKYISERDGIKCEPEFSELYGEFSEEQVDGILKKASKIFKGRIA